jgi:hypothetical protein
MRADRDERRNLNSDEMYAMGFVDLLDASNDDGWPYSDTDDEETTEAYLTSLSAVAMRRVST